MKIEPENRMITKCEGCLYEMDTLVDDMYAISSFIICTMCWDDRYINGILNDFGVKDD